MKVYRTKAKKLSGTSYTEVRRKAFSLYQDVKRKSRRKPYVRSAYFKKDKIFLDLFWSHLFEKKNFTDLMRRTKLYPCALELTQKSTLEPTIKHNPNKSSEVLYRFAGISEGETFCIQIKENRKTKMKYLISAFPYKL